MSGKWISIERPPCARAQTSFARVRRAGCDLPRSRREGASETELSQLRLGYALDAGRVHRLAAGVRVIGVAAHRHRVLRGAVAGEPDDMKVERVAESIQTPGDLGFLAVGVVRRRGREEAVLAAVGNERCEGRGRCAAGDRNANRAVAVVPLAANGPAVADASSVSDSPAADVSLVSDSPAPVASLASDSPTADVSPVSDSPVAEGALITESTAGKRRAAGHRRAAGKQGAAGQRRAAGHRRAADRRASRGRRGSAGHRRPAGASSPRACRLSIGEHVGERRADDPLDADESDTEEGDRSARAWVAASIAVGSIAPCVASSCSRLDVTASMPTLWKDGGMRSILSRSPPAPTATATGTDYSGRHAPVTLLTN